MTAIAIAPDHEGAGTYRGPVIAGARKPGAQRDHQLFGAIEVDIDAELAALGPTGYRPLRVRDNLF